MIISVTPNNQPAPIASTTFKNAYALAKSLGEILTPSLNYKPALNRIRRSGMVGIYCKSAHQSEDEAKYLGYVSIEEINLYNS